MQDTSIPAKFGLVWGANAGGAFIRVIPQASQIGIQNGAASLNDGFPPDNFTPVGAGGIPPFGQDFNGILKQITQWLQWQQAGNAFITYDTTFSTNIGGYPYGAVLAAAGFFPGDFWYSGNENNTNNPDTGGAGWFKGSYLAVSTGDIKWRPTSEGLLGWVVANATTIGNASSGATQRAIADTANLFAWHWNNFSNTQCPVSGGRGSTAAADYAANKTITVLDMRGTQTLGMDTMQGGATTRLNSVPVTSGNSTTAGSVLGENLHQLLIGELASHSHGVTDNGHAHFITDSGHTHAYTEPNSGQGHTHTTSSSPNASGFKGFSAGVNTGGGGDGGAQSCIVAKSVTGITITAAGTGISINSANTGISINSTGSDTAHNTVSRAMIGTFYIKL